MPIDISRLRTKKPDIDQIKEERRWNDLIDAVMEGRVIPVIGSDFLVDDEPDSDGNVSNLHQQIIDILASAYNVSSNPKSFSQLVYDKAFRSETNSDKEAIYMLINQILTQALEENQLRPSNLLQRLLLLRKFPFVITTSFTPIVEMAMRAAWPEKEVRVLQFRNDPKFDQVVGKGDIESELDMETPTVYYMFGKHCDESRYVVTDLDMMNFCRRWIAGGANVPRVLSEAIKKRYLLVLGNNYSDWLFRFIWYSMRPNTEIMRSSLMVHDKMDPTLTEFLERLQTFIQKDPQVVVSKIESCVNERLKKMKEENTGQQYDTDVFISYSRRDEEIAKRLYDALTSAGIRVWYDAKDIPGAADWKQTFLKGVRNTRLFIPILSANVAREYMQPHEYRDEWRMAASMASKMGGVDFIWPLAERGFEFYSEQNSLPQEFHAKNAAWYTIADDFRDFACEVKDKIEEIKRKEEDLKNG